MLGNLISGSRTPPLRIVSRMLIQSLNGPAVASPMSAPTTIAKFVNPTATGEKSYGGGAKTSDWVRFKVRKELQLHETTKAANSTMGKAKSFQGIQTSNNILLKG